MFFYREKTIQSHSK